MLTVSHAPETDRAAATGLRLACSTICFRTSPVEQALAEIVAAGFDAVDLALVPGFCDHFDALASPATARDAFVESVRSSGLRVATVTTVPGHFNVPGADVTRIALAAQATFDLAARLGARSVNLHCGAPVDADERDVHLMAQALGLRLLAARAADAGLAVNVEAPHRNGLCRTLSAAVTLLDGIGRADVRVVLDLAHVQASGAPPAEVMRHLGARIGHVHLRDAHGQDIFRVPGTGDVDFSGWFGRLVQVGYSGHCALELEGHGDTLAERRSGVRTATRVVLDAMAMAKAGDGP